MPKFPKSGPGIHPVLHILVFLLALVCLAPHKPDLTNMLINSPSLVKARILCQGILQAQGWEPVTYAKYRYSLNPPLLITSSVRKE